MVEVLKKVDELVQVLQLRIRSYEEGRRKAETTQQEAADLKTSSEAVLSQLTERVKSVEERETRVGQIESLQELERSVKGAQTALAAAREAFAKQQADALKKLEDEQQAVAAARGKLAEREKKLDEDRRTYKATVMKQLLDAGWKGPAAEE